MSHFCVAVFMEKFDEKKLAKLLSPYEEYCGREDFPKELLEFVDVEDEEFDSYKNSSSLDGKRFEEIYKTFEEFMSDCRWYSARDEIKHRYGYWHNPNAKWDWWVIGGRFHGKLISKSGKLIDHALVSDIDFETMKQKELQELEPFESCFERRFYKPEYFNSLYPDEEEYIKSKTSFATYAVITPDGNWHSHATMGYFGLDDSKAKKQEQFHKHYFESFIKPAIENKWHMVIVDCHI